MEKINVAKFKEMLLSGKTLLEIAEEFNTTKQNVSLWRKTWFPNLSKKDYGAGLRARVRLAQQTRKTMSHSDDVSRAKSLFFSRKKQNAKQKKWEFTISFSDVEWNDTCPILGTPINWDNDVRGENSPSMDRIDPLKGYVPGNVAIVSWRANRIKNDGSLQEHQQIVEYLSKRT